MMKIYDRLFETDRNQQSDRNGRDVDEKLSPSMNVLVRWMYFYHGLKRLTRIMPKNCVFKGVFFGPNPVQLLFSSAGGFKQTRQEFGESRHEADGGAQAGGRLER
jgi:hypothetical protein